MEQLIERINKLATPAKAGIVAAIILLITAGTYFLLIADLDTAIAGIKAEQNAKEITLAEKQAIADNLNERRKEMDALDQKFQEALTQLPEKKDIEELLSQLSDVGKKSGLEISKVVPGSEAAEGFYSRIPISMAVSGNYNEIAMFLQEIANLRRIVNVSDLKLGTPVVKGDKVTLSSDFMATTFRFTETKGGKK
ncbi:MAG: type 4a pilus biogenesis protein PilO [Archangium sp.]|nr:type 4a pilus biogenesis protein PilO [Archangium sp.]MDP3156181.1 type 4a pilus biogenesis protein PilO [Archangium sp.]MDP3571518.1 type 4a pilus biogenesis protein PilO [Archangium sp.]